MFVDGCGYLWLVDCLGGCVCLCLVVAVCVCGLVVVGCVVVDIW